MRLTGLALAAPAGVVLARAPSSEPKQRAASAIETLRAGQSAAWSVLRASNDNTVRSLVIHGCLSHLTPEIPYSSDCASTPMSLCDEGFFSLSAGTAVTACRARSVMRLPLSCATGTTRIPTPAFMLLFNGFGAQADTERRRWNDGGSHVIVTGTSRRGGAFPNEAAMARSAARGTVNACRRIVGTT